MLSPIRRCPPPASASRSRSGCLNCRKRRKKCDERKPSCTRCQRHSDSCQWQPDFMFRLSGVDTRHPLISQSYSRGGSSPAGLKIVDVTFGPEGVKKTRRQLVQEDSNSDHDDSRVSAELHSELGYDTAEDPPLDAETLPHPLWPHHGRPIRRFASRERQSPSVGDDEMEDEPCVSAEFESPMAQGQPIPSNHENHRRDSTTSGLSSSFSIAVNQRTFPEWSRNAATPGSLPEGGSPASLDLAVLDYLASNPLNLDILAANSWSEPAMASENLDGAIRGYPSPALPSAAGRSPDFYEANYHDAAYQELHSHLHNQMMQTARSRALTRQGTPEAFPGTVVPSLRQPSAVSWAPQRGFHATTGNVDQSWQANLPITEERSVELWQNYLDEICPWLDMFDNANHWRTTVAPMAQRVECLHYALLALSARQQERMNPGKPHTESLILYQEAIRLMKVQLPTLCTEVIAACVLLSVLEMMCSSPRAWGKHLDGCAILLEAAGINGVVGGVREALFWTFARMDVYRAFIDDTVTTLPTNRWFLSADSMSAAVRLFKDKPGSDSYANYVVFLCAGVVNILSNMRYSGPVPDRDAYATFVSRWKAMYDLHESWYNDRPEEMRPLMCVPPSKKRTSSAFSTILYSTSVGISSNQMYHASMILLLRDKPKEITLPKSHKSMLWHARQICGISLSNSDHGALVNALQPIWIAGRLMSHHSEHKAILDIFEHLEEQTGWATSWRAKDLKEFWGVCDEDS